MTVLTTEGIGECYEMGVQIQNGRVRASSRQVAKMFGKRHTNVLRAIDNLEISESERAAYFEPLVTTELTTGNTMREILMDRDGFTIVVMGFTGKAAMQFKLAYIRAFNRMELELRRVAQATSAARLEGKRVRKLESTVVQKFVKYAKDQGSSNADFYHMSITKMTYQVMGIPLPSKLQVDSLRDLLDSPTLMQLGTAESIVQQKIEEGMEMGLYYKQVFQYTKDAVSRLAELVRPQIEEAMKKLVSDIDRGRLGDDSGESLTLVRTVSARTQCFSQ